MPVTRPRRAAFARVLAAVTCLVMGLTAAFSVASTGASAAGATGTSAAERTDLHLVTLDGPGLAGTAPGPTRDLARWRIRAQQDSVLAEVQAPAPIYRWSTALNGLAVELTAEQARDLATVPGVALVEPDEVRPLAGRDRSDPAMISPGAADHGGEGVVIGMVDTGLDPDSPLFSATARLGRAPTSFHGACTAHAEWGPGWCTEKVVAAAWFVAGFGEHHLASSARLSPLDDVGHGTQTAAIAAGNSGVPVRVAGEALGEYAGVAPQARLAVYKACWTAPDPSRDGCSTADLVSAIDRATGDGVDVLNLSIGGPSSLDTVELALLGATEADIVVVGAAGSGSSAGTAHTSPWVTTVGASSGPVREGVLRLGQRSLVGAMASMTASPRARLVRGADAAATGVLRAAARRCEPRSLDASVVARRIVVCQRGGVGRVDKSRAVAEADGVGMVLLNSGPRRLEADLHAVPTVHLGAADAKALHDSVARHPQRRVVLVPRAVGPSVPRVPGWSSAGDPSAAYPKPDVVAPGQGVLGAVPGSIGWDFLTGTSAAAAWVSGAAARLRADSGWSAAAVRSALVTTAQPVPGDLGRTGAGRVRLQAMDTPALVVGTDPTDYRRWLTGRLASLNTPALVVRRNGTLTRTVTHVGRRARYFSTSAVGFTDHEVVVTPAALRLGPGESEQITVRVAPGAVSERGAVLLRGGDGARTRLPLLITR